MTIKEVLVMTIVLISLTTVVEAKQVIVGYSGNFDFATLEEYNISNYTVYHEINAFSANISDVIINEISCENGIRYIEEDYLVCIEKKDFQPSQNVDWGVDKVNAPISWEKSTGSGIKIAVIDTGINKKHPDLNIAGGVNLVGDAHNKKWDDDNGHGTYVAGIVGACNNSIGIVGVAYDAELYAVKVLDSSGNGQISDVVEGIGWAVQNDIDIITMSFGTNAYSQVLNDACSNAYNSGVILVAAVGNDGDGNTDTNEVTYPAKYDTVIAVSAVDFYNIAPSWSADGYEVELVAPGVNVRSTYLEDKYTIESGTSVAVPFVSGIAALFKSENVSLNPQEIRNLLANNAFDLGDEGRDKKYGFGLVQAS